MIIDFQEYKKNKERILLDIRAGTIVLQKLLFELNINPSPELVVIKKEIRTTIKLLSDKVNESTRNKSI